MLAQTNKKANTMIITNLTHKVTHTHHSHTHTHTHTQHKRGGGKTVIREAWENEKENQQFLMKTVLILSYKITECRLFVYMCLSFASDPSKSIYQ